MQNTYPKIQNMPKNSTRSWNFELKISNSAKNVGLLRNPIPYHILTCIMFNYSWVKISITPLPTETHTSDVTWPHLPCCCDENIKLHCVHITLLLPLVIKLHRGYEKILCSVYVRWPEWKQIIIGAETKWKHWVLGVLTSLTYRKLRYNFQNLD